MKKITLFLCTLMLLSACASTQGPKSKSEFLKSYDNFKPHPQKKGTWFSTTEHFDYQKFKSYDKVAFAPITLWLSKDKPYQIKDIKKQEAIVRYFENTLKKRLNGSKEVVQPGTQDSLLIKLAITYIGERSSALEALDFLPFRIVMNGGEMAYLTATDQKIAIGEATIEVEFVDTNSNLGLVSAILENETDEIYVNDTDDNIEAAKAILNSWTERLHLALSDTKI